MSGSRTIAWQVARGVALLCCLAAVSAAEDADKAPAPLSPAQRHERLEERDRLARQAKELRDAGKLPEAAAAVKKVVAIEREVFGKAYPKVALSLDWLADIHQQQENFTAARKARAQRLEVIAALNGDKHWRTTDARLELAYVERLAALSAAQREQLNQADALVGRMQTLHRENKYQQAIQAGRKAAELRAAILGREHHDYAAAVDQLGTLYNAAGDAAGAEPLYRQAVDIRRKSLGPEHPDYAASLNRLGTLYDALGELARAEPLYREALEIRKKVLGERDPDYAQSLNSLGSLYSSLGDYRRAEPLYREATELFKKGLGAQHPVYATSLNNLAYVYSMMGDYARAEPLYRQALEIKKKSLGEEHPDYPKSLHNLGYLYSAMGDHARAEPLHREAAELTRKILGEEHPTYATSLNSLGFVYQARGDYARAEPLYQQALEIRAKTLGRQHPDYAQCLNNLGSLYKAVGDYGRAESQFRQAAEIWQKVFGDEHPTYATSLNNLAVLYELMGDYARAEPLYRQALEIREKTLGKEHPSYASSASNLGSLFSSMGDYPRAEPLLAEALAINRKLLGNEHPACAESLNNLGLLYESMRDYPRAEQSYREAMEIRAKALGEDHPDYAVSLNNLGSLYNSMGDYARAEPLYRRALELTKKTLDEEHPAYATALNNVANVCSLRGDYARAEPLYQQAVAINRKLLGEDHAVYATTLGNLGNMYDLMGDHARAEPLYRRALAIVRRHLELTSAVQSERQQLAMTGMLQGYLHTFVALAERSEELAPAAYRETLAWKGAVLTRQRQLRAVANQGELEPLWAELQSSAARIAQLALATPDPKTTDMDARRRQIAELSDEKERLETELAKRSAAFREARKPLSVEDLQAALPPETALVDFLEHRVWKPPEEEKKGTGTWEPRLAAFVVRSSGPIRLVDLGSAAPISDAIDRWRNEIRAKQGGVARGSRGLALEKQRSPTESTSAALERLVWKPIEQHLGGAVTVLISPDGATARLPFAALPGKKAGVYLIEEVALVVIPVPQDLSELLRAEQARAVAPSLLLVGDVDFGAAQDAAAPGGAQAIRGGVLPAMRFDALAGTAREIDLIAATLKKTHRDAPLAILRRSDATEERFTKLAPAHRFVHLATHGYFAPPQVKSALDHSDEPRRGTRSGSLSVANRQQLVGLHPGLLSGIALAGANARAARGDATGDREDGLLTALEAAGLDLRATELVTLSACETGLGKVAGGEGVLGLQRAFQIAGSRSTVTSLWSVDDDATQALMSAFYENLWTHKMGTLEALRAAQLSMLRRYDPAANKLSAAGDKPQSAEAKGPLSPYYWAAFVLSGDWR